MVIKKPSVFNQKAFMCFGTEECEVVLFSWASLLSSPSFGAGLWDDADSSAVSALCWDRYLPSAPWAVSAWPQCSTSAWVGLTPRWDLISLSWLVWSQGERMYGHRCTPMSHLFGRWGEEGKEREVPEDLILFAGQIQRLLWWFKGHFA